MKKVITDIEDIKNTIKWIDIFDLQIIGMPKPEQPKEDLRKYMSYISFRGFSACVSEIGFGDNNDIFVIYNDFDKGQTLESINDECLSEGMRLIIADRDGTPIGNYLFEATKLVSKVPIILGYDNTYVIKRNPYILVFKYSNVYKFIND